MINCIRNRVQHTNTSCTVHFKLPASRTFEQQVSRTAGGRKNIPVILPSLEFVASGRGWNVAAWDSAARTSPQATPPLQSAS